MKAEDLKLAVKEKYGEIANQSYQKEKGQSSCCGTSGCCGELEFAMIGDEYKDVKGYQPDADLGLGCGLPTQFADLKVGDHVLDLGCGAGNDCFVARAKVDDTGKVTGIDFTDAMLEKARKNNTKLGYPNVEFIKGDIEDMPFDDNEFDVVVSNCVLNPVPDKKKAFSEIYRVLKPGGHFCVSDVVVQGTLSEALQKDVEMYAGCVSGAIPISDYLDIIKQRNFTNVEIHKKKAITIPDETLSAHAEPDDIEKFHRNEIGIFSITISGKK